MSIPYEDVGRTQQKHRTRAALIDAAREVIAAGLTPTVEDAAARSGISRTTAYRYFRNQRELIVAAHPEVDARSMLGDDPPADVDARVDLVVDRFARITVETEPALRTMLRLSLEPENGRREPLLLRGGRAIGWLKEALEPLKGRLSEQEIERLVFAIRASVGIEPLVWLCDVAGLSRSEAVEIMKRSARAILRAALTDAGVG